MKNLLIAEVQQKMLPYLNNEQLLRLQEALETCLAEVIIEPGDKETSSDEPDAIAAFIAAKRIEGCSEKTLKYYEKTILAVVNYIGKRVQQITTDDLRQ